LGIGRQDYFNRFQVDPDRPSVPTGQFGRQAQPGARGTPEVKYPVTRLDQPKAVLDL